jgi:hypothetical protein
VKKLNSILLIFEIFICILTLSGQRIGFGHGAMDFFFLSLFYIAVFIHLAWTIIAILKQKSFTISVIVFTILTLLVLSKATFFRGSTFPWDGDLFVNHGKIKPNRGTRIFYRIISSFANKDSTLILNLPDPGKRYWTTLYVSDPECTDCNDCVMDSGALLIPDTLNFFIKHPISKGVLLLEGKSPYKIEAEPYIRYKIAGQIIGVQHGKFVFYVSDWERR